MFLDVLLPNSFFSFPFSNSNLIRPLAECLVFLPKEVETSSTAVMKDVGAKSVTCCGAKGRCVYLIPAREGSHFSDLNFLRENKAAEVVIRLLEWFYREKRSSYLRRRISLVGIKTSVYSEDEILTGTGNGCGPQSNQ